MASYIYKAVTFSGAPAKGKVEAINREVALMKIKEMELYPVEVKEDNVLTKEISFGSSVGAKDLTIFCSQFGAIISAGIPILEALYMLKEQIENKVFKRVISEIYLKVEQGEQLSSAMSNYKKIFPDILVNMVKAGEATGNLEISFNRMALHFDKEYKLQQEVKKASIYPIVVGIVALGVVIMLLVVVVPTFTKMFSEMGAELPATTKMLIAMSDFVTGRWYMIILFVIIIIVLIQVLKRNDDAKLFFSKLSLSMPIIGKVKVKIISSRFARTMSTLLASGLPILDTIEIVSRVVSNEYVKNSLEEAREQVSKGVPLSEPIKNMEVFPPMVIHMVKIGEESGRLEDVLEHVADFYDNEVETAVSQLTAMMEPAIIVFLAVIVGFIVISIIQPMFQMYTLIEGA